MKKYEIVYEKITYEIENGHYPLGTILPTESKLSDYFDCSRVTIRKSLSELEKDGYISKRQGSGSFVIKDVVRSKIVLLILPDIFKYIFVELIEGIETTLRDQNISLLIANSFSDKSIERLIIKNHIDLVDAIIIEPTQVKNTNYSSSKTYSKLLKKPTVCINTRIDELDLPYLILDDKSAMNLVARNIVNLNRKRILSFYKTDDLQGFQRLAGVKEVLDEALVDFKSVEFDSTNIDSKFEDFSFLYFHFKPDCLIFYNDEYAYKFLTTYNINPITDNIYVVGFDDTAYSNGHPYKFVSPTHPKKLMGIDAASMIVNIINRNPVKSITYKPYINFDK